MHHSFCAKNKTATQKSRGLGTYELGVNSQCSRTRLVPAATPKPVAVIRPGTKSADAHNAGAYYAGSRSQVSTCFRTTCGDLPGANPESHFAAVDENRIACVAYTHLFI